MYLFFSNVANSCSFFILRFGKGYVLPPQNISFWVPKT